MTTDILKSEYLSVVKKVENPSGSRSALYPCKQCLKSGTGKSFTSQSKLNAHIKQCHSSCSLICDICFKSIRNTHSLNRHKKTVHSGAQKSSCSICRKTYSARSSLQEHMFTAHKVKTGNRSYSKCDLCSKEFAGIARLESHIVEKHVVDKEFECSVCFKKCIDLQSLDRHKRARHKSITTIFTCDVCSAEFAFKKYLLKHLKHSHPNHTHCLKCGRTFINKLQFSQHLESIPKDSGAFKCQICHVTCTSQCNFDLHNDCHIGKLKSKADQCQSQRNDEGGGGFKCGLCLEAFDTESNLASHRKNIHRIRKKELKCKFKNCLKNFESTTLLRRHKLSHHSMEGAPSDSGHESLAPPENLPTQK